LDLIAANLPYVTDAEMNSLPPEVRDYEPLAALSGGADGLDAVRCLIAGFSSLLKSKGCLLVEIGPAQAATVARLLRRKHRVASVAILTDLAGWERAVRLVI